jgi:hypothetical protein
MKSGTSIFSAIPDLAKVVNRIRPVWKSRAARRAV